MVVAVRDKVLHGEMISQAILNQTKIEKKIKKTQTPVTIILLLTHYHPGNLQEVSKAIFRPFVS